MSITAEQRKWLDELGHIVGSRPPGEAPPELESAHANGSGGIGDVVGFPTFPGIDIDVKVESIVSEILIHNDSSATLQLIDGSQKLVRPRLSRFDPGPDVKIAPGGKCEFKVISGSSTGINISRPGNTSGEVRYEVLGAEPAVTFLMKWHRGWPIAKRDADSKVTPDDGRFSIEDFDKKDDNFEFIVSGLGDPKPDPDPDPDPKPDPDPTPDRPPTDPKNDPVPTVDLQSSCLITVTNTTPHALTLSDNGHERGDFMMLVPAGVPPGGTVSFVSLETPASPDPGCKGFAVWEVGSPMIATWRIEWDNPEGEKNTTNATVTPQTSGLRSTDQTGQGDENVPVAFTLSGGAAPGDDTDDDKPDDTDDDKTDPAPPSSTGFEPPVESKQPTLRRGDESQDQWVEYAQGMLSYHLGVDLATDGDFGKSTESAVKKFQKRKGLAVDGIIGNQTWAALREGSPESPSTDGREPNSYLEAGAEARWVLESETNNAWLEEDDVYSIFVVAVGDAPLDPTTEATLRVAAPGAAPAVVKLKLGPADGLTHLLQVRKFRATFPSVPPDASITGYRVEAYLPKELGGDYFAASVRAL